jgi:hypothetical protein
MLANSLTSTGQVETFINRRGGGSGGMVPNWQYDAITHYGLSGFGVTDANSRVKFGRMYGTGRRDVRFSSDVSRDNL